jgi:Holliday junction DNA helicase RuvA
MIYSLKGKLEKISDNFLVLENSGIGFKIFTSASVLRRLSSVGSEVKCFCFLHVREDAFDVFGFLEEEALKLFEMLIAVSGVGPRTALGIMDVDRVENIMAAIIERRPEFLTRASGIGTKTAERIVLELHNKIKLPKSETLTKVMDLNMEVEEALVGLGYARYHVKKVLGELDPQVKNLEDRVRLALKALSGKSV